MNENIWCLIFAGICSGTIAGMGMGGGTLLIPILTILLSFEQKNAQGINLIVFIPMALVALIIHIKNKLVDFKVGIPVILSGVLFSIGGSILANKLNSRILKKIFGVFLIIVGIYQIISTIILIKKSRNKGKNSQIKFKIIIK